MGVEILYQDTAEPELMLKLLKQSVTTLSAPLNADDPPKPDYWWLDLQDKRRGWSRKQLGEALSDLDAVEDQINRELSSCDEYTLVIEGVGLAAANGYQPFTYHGKGEFCHKLRTNQPHFCEGYFQRRIGWRQDLRGLRMGYGKPVSTWWRRTTYNRPQWPWWQRSRGVGSRRGPPSNEVDQVSP